MTYMKTRLLSVCLLASVGTFAHAMFTNGDFETGDLTGWTITPTSGGTTAIQDAFQYDIDGGGPLGTNFAGRFSVGRNTGVTTGDHGVWLTQSLMLTAGVAYTFDFDWSAFRPAGQAANTQGGIFNLIVDGVVLATGAAGSTSGAAPKYGHVTASFVPTATGLHSVGASMLRPFTIPSPAAPTLFQAVDNFTVTAVPEPATMVALGLGAAALLRRRRKA